MVLPRAIFAAALASFTPGAHSLTRVSLAVEVGPARMDGHAEMPAFLADSRRCSFEKEFGDACMASPAPHVYVNGGPCHEWAVDACKDGVADNVWQAAPSSLRRSPGDVAASFFEKEMALLVNYGDSTMKQQRRSLNCLMEAGGAELLRKNQPTHVGDAWLWRLGGKTIGVVPSIWSEKYPEINRTRIEDLVAAKDSAWTRILIVFGLGLHYNDMKEYSTDLSDFVSWSKTLHRDDFSVVLREPPAQHFENGQYMKGTASTGCQQSNLLVTQGRQQVFNDAVKGSDLARTTLKIYNDSAPLWFAHSDPVWKPNDCTHYCFAVPYLWNVAFSNLVGQI